MFYDVDVVKHFMKLTGKHQSRIADCRPQACKFIKKDTPVTVFSSKFFKCFESNYFVEHL